MFTVNNHWETGKEQDALTKSLFGNVDLISCKKSEDSGKKDDNSTNKENKMKRKSSFKERLCKKKKGKYVMNESCNEKSAKSSDSSKKEKFKKLPPVNKTSDTKCVQIERKSESCSIVTETQKKEDAKHNDKAMFAGKNLWDPGEEQQHTLNKSLFDDVDLISYKRKGDAGDKTELQINDPLITNGCVKGRGVKRNKEIYVVYDNNKDTSKEDRGDVDGDEYTNLSSHKPNGLCVEEKYEKENEKPNDILDNNKNSKKVKKRKQKKKIEQFDEMVAEEQKEGLTCSDTHNDIPNKICSGENMKEKPLLSNECDLNAFKPEGANSKLKKKNKKRKRKVEETNKIILDEIGNPQTHLDVDVISSPINVCSGEMFVNKDLKKSKKLKTKDKSIEKTATEDERVSNEILSSENVKERSLSNIDVHNIKPEAEKRNQKRKKKDKKAGDMVKPDISDNVKSISNFCSDDTLLENNLLLDNKNDVELKKSKAEKRRNRKKKKARVEPVNDKNEKILGSGEENINVENTKDQFATEKNLFNSPMISQSDKYSLKYNKFQKKILDKLKGGQFRWINEKLYSCKSSVAVDMFSSDPKLFDVYHNGFTSQVQQWPQNPVDVIIAFIKARDDSLVIADFGCGDAKISKSVPNKVHSFDLVSANEHVTACDMKKVPLERNSIHVAVFCLSLMGTNIVEFLIEAHRVIKARGILKIAEVKSRFEDTDKFIKDVSSIGFSLTEKDDSNKMFILLEFEKTEKIPSKKASQITLQPCIYKRR